MEPEIPTESNRSKKKFLIIALGILVVAGAVVGYLFMQKDTPPQGAPVPVAVITPVATPPKIYTQEEKDQLAKDILVSVAKDTLSQAERDRRAKTFTNVLSQPTTVLSIEERTRLAQELMAKTQ